MNRTLTIFLPVGILLSLGGALTFSPLAWADPDTDLARAAHAGDLSGVKRALSEHANPNAGDSNGGMTPLMWAAEAGRAAIIKILGASGAHIDTQNQQGRTALMLASREGRNPVLLTLLDLGADINTRDNKGSTALMGAAVKGHAESVRILLSHGANPNTPNDNNGVTPLMVATFKGYEKVAKVLVDGGADVNARNNFGGTALMGAASADQASIARILIAGGADVNARDTEGKGQGSPQREENPDRKENGQGPVHGLFSLVTEDLVIQGNQSIPTMKRRKVELELPNWEICVE